MGSRVYRTIILGLRVLYVVMMMLFLILIVTNSIGGYGTVGITLIILTIVFVEMWAKKNMTPM